MKKRKLKRWVKLLIIRLIMVYLIGGIIWCAIDSHQNPDKHRACVIEEVC